MRKSVYRMERAILYLMEMFEGNEKTKRRADTLTVHGYMSYQAERIESSKG
jgi:hypothetical protein